MISYFDELAKLEIEAAAARKVTKEDQRRTIRKMAKHLQSVRESVDMLDLTMQAVGYKPESDEEVTEVRALLDILKDELGLGSKEKSC